MSSEGKYANGNKYVVTVLPSTSPNRRFLVFILVAVALVVLVVLTATLIPIYMTGDGEDKDKGQLSETQKGNDSLTSSTRSIVIGSSTTPRYSFDSVSKFAVSTSRPQQGPSSRTTSPSEMISSSAQVTRTTNNTLAPVSSSSSFARSSTTQSNLDSVLDRHTTSKVDFSLMSSPSVSSASSRGIIDISTSKHEESTSLQTTYATTTIIKSGPSRHSTSVKFSVTTSSTDFELRETSGASLPNTVPLTTTTRAGLSSSIDTSAKATSTGFEPVETSSASLSTTPRSITTLRSVVLSSSMDERPSLSALTSYSIHADTTTGSILALSSMAQLLPNSDAKWSRWSSWSDCTRTCGNGTRFRTRKCVAQNQFEVFAPIFCAGKHYQNKTCADWGCPDCSKICVKGTLNANCDACTCGDHVLTGRVQTKNNAPLSEAEISLAETPYNVLAQTNATGFFTALNVCADANQDLLIARQGFVPVKIKATILTSTTANVKATLENAVPPSITVHPRSKMRISGHGVTFCCDGEGNPTPEFEWFKDNNIIDKDVYHYNKTLEISDVSGLMGGYRCRVVNDYGSEFSDVANLQVFNATEEISCNPTPITKNATLPTGCVVQGTSNSTVDVGQCLPKPCLRNDSALSNTACHDETFCCVAEETEDVTISCGGAAIFNISKVSRCGCQECETPKSYITGVVVGIKGAVEKPIIYCEIKIGGYYYNADDKGAFKIEVPDDKQRLSVVFKDIFDEEYDDLTKVFRIVQGQALFSKIVLRVKPAPKPFNSSEPFKVPLGDSGDGSDFAEIEIPEDALLKEDGTIYSGEANLRLSVTDPRNATDVMRAPADFSTIDEDGEEQILVSYGMLSLDFEDDSGNKLSTSKSIKMFLDPEKLNISVDSNGNTTTKLWWLDENTGRWMEAGDLWLDTKETNRSRRSPTRFLLAEITPVIQRQGKINIDAKEDFGAVRVAAPPGSTVRILCKEPNARGEQYAGYLEGAVDASSVTCISVWIDRECFMQGESSDARFLVPSSPDAFPPSVSASIIQTGLQSVGSSASVQSFMFEIRTDNNGPVYPHSDIAVQNCRAPELIAGHRQFEFTSPPSAGLDLTSRPTTPNFRDPLNWYPGNTNCFIKIVTTGPRGSTFLASSYRANRRDNANKFGDSVAMANPATDRDNTFVACLDIRCPGNVYHQDTRTQVPEWTYVLVTHLTGSCDFQNHHLQNQDNLDNNGASCPAGRSKRHAAGSENWFCIPLPSGGGFDIDNVYTASPRQRRRLGVNRCNTGNNDWDAGPSNPSSNSPTIEFTCS